MVEIITFYASFYKFSLLFFNCEASNEQQLTEGIQIKWEQTRKPIERKQRKCMKKKTE